MNIRDRFPNVQNEELLDLLERVDGISKPMIKKITEKQADNLIKYWDEIHYILQEKGLELTLSECKTKVKVHGEIKNSSAQI